MQITILYYCTQPPFLPETNEPGELHRNDWALLLIASVHAQWLQAVLPKDVWKVMRKEKRVREAVEC